MTDRKRRFEPGEEVVVSYVGYLVHARVVGPADSPFRDWTMVEELWNTRGNDYRDRDQYPDGGPVYEAANEFITRPNEDPAPDPLAEMMRAFTEMSR